MRKETIHVQAYDLQGNEIEGDVDRVCCSRCLQHETDHLDGTLFIDRLGPAQLADIKDQLYEFELNFRSRRETGELPSDEAMAARLKEFERATNVTNS